MVVGVDDVVGGGVYVEDHVLVVVGAGGVYVDVGVVEVGCESSEEPISQSPVRTPASRDPKYWNNPWEKSRPPYPHPGHCGITR